MYEIQCNNYILLLLLLLGDLNFVMYCRRHGDVMVSTLDSDHYNQSGFECTDQGCWVVFGSK